MSLSEVASPRATEPNTAIERPRRRRTRSRISMRFRSRIERRSGPGAMATACDPGSRWADPHRSGPRTSSAAASTAVAHHLPARGVRVTRVTSARFWMSSSCAEALLELGRRDHGRLLGLPVEEVFGCDQHAHTVRVT
jgi:hypothetical protein